MGRGCTNPRRGKGSGWGHVVRSWQHYSATAQPVRLPPCWLHLLQGYTTVACTQACPSRSWPGYNLTRKGLQPEGASPGVSGSHPVEVGVLRPLASSTCACRSAPWRGALLGSNTSMWRIRCSHSCKRHGAGRQRCWGRRCGGRGTGQG